MHHYFKYSLEHPVMFEALIALSLSHLRVNQWRQGHADKETTYHYGNILSRLQQTLQEGDGFRETAVLWAILALIELEVSQTLTEPLGDSCICYHARADRESESESTWWAI